MLSARYGRTGDEPLHLMATVAPTRNMIKVSQA